jgi:DNA-binding transcriptional LysR family regulator
MHTSPLARRMMLRLRVRHLELISAVYDHGSILKASQQLNLTQPAVTKSLQDIEEILGLQLFVRSNRGLQSTHYGEIFVRHAKGVLARLRHSAEELQNLVQGVGGHVTVGTLLTASAELLPQAILELKRERPTVVVTVLDGTYDVLLPRLRMGDLDLVVGRLPDEPLDGALIAEEFHSAPSVLVVRREHPLAGQSQLSLGDLVDQPWLFPVPESYLRRQLARAFAEAKLPLPINIIESVSALTNRALLNESDLIGAMPFHVIRREVRQGALVVLPIPLPGTRSPVGAIMRAPGDLRPSAAGLLEHLRTVGRQMKMEVAPEA